MPHLTKNTSIMYLGKPIWLLTISLFLAAVPALSQAVSNPNQIRGTIRFMNTNPDILKILQSPPPMTNLDHGFHNGSASASSVVSPSHPIQFVHRTDVSGNASQRVALPYEISVESGPVGDGISYDVSGSGRLLVFNGMFYFFAPVRSAPVEEEPAPDVEVDIEECATMLHIRWIREDDSPFTINTTSFRAFPENPNLPGTFLSSRQAFGDYANVPTSEAYYFVRSGIRQKVEIFYGSGNDPYSDQFQSQVTLERFMPCDEIVPVDIVIPIGGLGGGDGLPRIIGRVDMLGESENFGGVSNDPIETEVRAEDGPFFNFRLDALRLTPSSGPFELENLIPSDAVSPDVGYRVQAKLFFRLGNDWHAMLTPELNGDVGDRNQRAFVYQGQDVDLQDTFVMDPGFQIGDIYLAGPPQDSFGDSCLADIRLVEDGDSDGDGTPPVGFLFGMSHLRSLGVSQSAPGSTFDARGGFVNSGFHGSLVGDDYMGWYEQVLGGLGSQASIWDSRFLELQMAGGTEDDEGRYHFGITEIVNHQIGQNVIVPGQTIRRDHVYCFSEVRLGYRVTNGTFFNPNVTPGLGSFQSVDFQGQPASYSVNIRGIGSNGIPFLADTGSVRMCLPQGTYKLTPRIVAVNPSGGFSDTQLPDVNVEVGCREVKNITLGLAVNVDPLPACTNTHEIALTGTAASTGDVPTQVTHISASVNDGAEIEYCTSCGANVSFVIDVPLEMCDNRVTVNAVDPFGDAASTTLATRNDPKGPDLLGCQDIDVDDEPGQGGAIVEFEINGLDECDGSVPVECSAESGSFFSQGLHEVTCSSSDSCGNRSTCTFSVSVCQAVEPDVRTQGFWKRQCQGQHPSGEWQKLESYVDGISKTETFSEVDSRAELCAELDPQPKNDKCQQAEAQLMALLLNNVSARVKSCNCMEGPILGEGTVAEAIAHIDGLLSELDRDHASCREAQEIADRLNRGTSLIDCQ